MEEISSADKKAIIREYIVGSVCKAISSVKALHDSVHRAAVDGLLENAQALGVDRDEYEMMMDGRGSVDRYQVAENVGLYVSDMIREWIDNERNDPKSSRADRLIFMLSELLDLDDSAQHVLFGEQFMPDVEDVWPENEVDDVPEDFPVAVLSPEDDNPNRATCGECGRSWDDSIPTSYTPVPSGRCPFESFH